MTWQEGRELWEAKGYNLEGIARDIDERFPNRRGLSRASIAAHSMPSEDMPPDVAEYIQSLRVLNAEKYEQFLQKAQAPAATASPEAIAAAVVAKLDVDGLAARVAAQLPKSPDADAVADKVAEKMPRMPSAEVVAAGVERRLLRWFVGLSAVLAVVVLVLIALVLRLAMAPSAPNSAYFVNLGTVVIEEAAKVGRSLAQWVPFPEVFGATMGERKKRGPPVPHQPMPGQARAPCPGSSKPLYGACYYETKNTSPCPEDQYQDGESCYVPISANPNAPVGAEAELRQAEPR